MVFLSLRHAFAAFIVWLSILLVNPVEAATLIVADNLQLREVNDERVNDSFFDYTFSKDKSITLPEGNNTLLIKYKDVYEDMEFAEERLVESEFFIVKFSITNQQTVKLETPKIKDLSAAERFSQSPEIMLLDENNTPVVLVLEKHSDYKLAKQVTKVITTLPEQVLSEQALNTKKTAENNNINKLKNNVSESVNTVKNNDKAFSDQVLMQTKSLPMLKYWWQKASTQEKQAFILYVKGIEQ